MDTPATPSPSRDVHHRLAELRVESGRTQRCVADVMGCTQSVVSALESGGRDLQLKTLERWAAALGRDVTVSFPARQPCTLSESDVLAGAVARGSSSSGRHEAGASTPLSASDAWVPGEVYDLRLDGCSLEDRRLVAVIQRVGEQRHLEFAAPSGVTELIDEALVVDAQRL